MSDMSETHSDDKLLNAIAYWGSLVLGFLPALVLFVLKKDESPSIRKHALQSMALDLVICAIFIALTIFSTIVGSIPIIGMLALLIMLGQIVVMLAAGIYILYLGYQVFQGQDPEIPYLTAWLQQKFPAP